jgi:hypothetical protein
MIVTGLRCPNAVGRRDQRQFRFEGNVGIPLDQELMEGHKTVVGSE